MGATGRLRICRKQSSELYQCRQRLLGPCGVEEGVSLWTPACGLLLLLASAGLGPEYSGVLSACRHVPSSFLHHPDELFCAFKDQFGLTMLRQGVDVAVNLHHLMVGTEGTLEVLQAISPPVFTLLCWQLANLCMDTTSDEELWRPK